ncbi:nucleolar protein 58 [Ischnura elegans]|uniref:nucleolar protein 58 n=1 Tax=Ischnura elegans TaxID=197161 RepID=UPI001ED8A4B3|nr:nucleolar protein 58 [Ischnura elegans]
MLVLFETPAGYAFFKLLDDSKLQETENLFKDFETPDAASKVVKLKHFQKFNDTTEALSAATAAVEGKLSKILKKSLKKVIAQEAQEQLLVADAKLGGVIKEKLNIQCLSNTAVQELMRCIRSQTDALISGLPKKEMAAMALGLAHSLSRYKLKFSPDKIDTMIVQAVCLLDDLDKELNNYIMRCREWYGWHFPELGKIITDHTAFVKTVKLIGTRENTMNTDLSDILPEEVEEKVKEAAEISMGTEITENDILNIQMLCDQVLEISDYRTQLYEYLKSRMMAVAPNLTVLVGDLVGARLISHAGSLLNLAKHPASTVQILGAEKALFRALKTKRDTPKYGLLYHSQLVGQSSAKNKGKMSRMLAAKAALACRVDALGDDEPGSGNNFELGAEHKAKLEARLRILEEGSLKRISGTGKAKSAFEKYYSKSEVRQFPAAADTTLPTKRKREEDTPKKVLIEEIGETEGAMPPKKKKKIKTEPQEEEGDEVFEEPTSEKKKKKKIKTEAEEEEAAQPSSEKKKKIKAEIEEQEGDEATPVKKKKKKVKEEVEDPEDSSEVFSAKKLKVKGETGEAEDETSVSGKKKKKKKSGEFQVEELGEEEAAAAMGSEKKKKKKKLSMGAGEET